MLICYEKTIWNTKIRLSSSILFSEINLMLEIKWFMKPRDNHSELSFPSHQGIRHTRASRTDVIPHTSCVR